MPQVQFGNPHPKEPYDHGGPGVTYINVPGSYSITDTDDTDGIMRHLWRNPDITHLPEHEALVSIIHNGGVWKQHSDGAPSWIWSDNPILQKQLQSLYQVGDRPDDYEETHQTLAGRPGVVPNAAVDLEMNITQNGRDIFARNMFSGVTAVSGSGTGTTTTSITGATGLTASAYIGYRVYAFDNTAHVFAWGDITANGTTSVTVDQWYNPNTYAVQALTNGTTYFVIADTGAPNLWMALTANSSSPAAPSTATSLTGEITTVGGGLIRKVVTYAHTASAATVTLTAVYTANGTDALPVTIAKIGVFNSALSSDTTDTMLFETLLTTSATLSASGDQLTVTETVTTT